MADDPYARIAQIEAENASLRAELRQARDEIAAGLRREATLVSENTVLAAERSDALEQQTATAEVLRVIASAPTDRVTVLDAIASAAMRFTESDAGAVQLVVGQRLQPIGLWGWPDAGPDGQQTTATPGPAITRQTISGRTLLERTTIHVPDVSAATLGEYPDSRPAYLAFRNESQ